MPRLTIQTTNFTSGEISPRLYGRTDIAQYQNAAKSLLNSTPVIHGGAKRRPGSRFIKAAKFGNAKARLIPFVVKRDLAYMLEVGASYIRVYKAGGLDMGVELATPYDITQVPTIDYVQGESTMFMFEASDMIQRLRRFSDTSWDIADAPFLVQPFDEVGLTPATTLTLSAATIGTGRTATAGSAIFLASDVGRVITSGAGSLTITAYNSPTQVTGNITIAFAGTAIASGAWNMDSSPQAFLKPTAKDPVGTGVDLKAALTRNATLTLSAKTGSITINASAAVFVPGDSGKVLYADSGEVTLTYVNATQCSGTTTTDFISTSYPTGSWGITSDAWRSTDVGAFVNLNGGLLKITAFVDATKVNAQIQQALTSTVVAPPFAWSVEYTVWSANSGYPVTGTLHEQRLVLGGSKTYPQTIWGSVTGEYLNFTKGTNDSDSFIFTLASDEASPIRYLSSMRNLLVNTDGGEFSLQGGIEKPITPTNVRIRAESNFGCAAVRPVTVDKENLFVQRAALKVHAMSYDSLKDGWSSPDITVFSEHITESGIVDMCYQKEPDLFLWAARTDGQLLSCTYSKDPSVGVTAWSQHLTEGAVEAVASIPNGDQDETWMIVRRTVNGADVRYIEILDSSFQPQIPAPITSQYPPFVQPDVYGYTVDCGKSFDTPTGQTTFSVPHLALKTVDIVADGSVMPQQVADASGNVTISRPAFRTLIGLHFENEIGVLTPEVGTGTGTAQGNSMRTSEITLRLLETIGGKVYGPDGREIGILPFRQLGPNVLDQTPALFSGLKRTESLGWERGESEFTIRQTQPLPMHVLAVIRKFQVND